MPSHHSASSGLSKIKSTKNIMSVQTNLARDCVRQGNCTLLYYSIVMQCKVSLTMVYWLKYISENIFWYLTLSINTTSRVSAFCWGSQADIQSVCELNLCLTDHCINIPHCMTSLVMIKTSPVSGARV